MYKIGYNNSTKHYGTSFHYEKPDRLEYCIGELITNIDGANFIPLSQLDISKAINLVEHVHSGEYLSRIKDFSSKIFICRKCDKKNISYNPVTFLDFISKTKECANCSNQLDLDNLYCYVSIDTYYTPYTYKIALDSISIILELLDVMKEDNKIKSSFALVRPPGHHCNNDPNGFCIFNNVFIGTKYAQSLGWNKILILDIDFHHGDGTQALIQSNKDPNISFVSIHGYGEKIYPGTGKYSYQDDNILNIPINMNLDTESRLYITDEYYQNILVSQVFPFIDQQNPDLIIISLGFDAHQDDPLEGMNITDETYLFLTTVLKNYSKPLLFVTEGGYNVKTIRRLIPKMINIFEN